MPGTVRCLLVLPISPSEPGNGLAHRCRFWQEVVGRLGDLTTVVVPVSGPAWAGDVEVLLDGAVATDLLPGRARRAPEHLGRAWAAEQPGFDLILAVRADVALFALGAATASGAVVVVDLDDDDAALHASSGDAEEATRYERLVREIRSRADLVTSVTGFGGTVPVPNSVAVPEHPLPRTDAGTDRVLMVGNFTYAPNLEGARWFLDEVAPRIAADRAGVDIVLAGPGSEALPPVGLGFVDDVTVLYAAASVAVVPLLHGSGSRIKALEAFALGVPVVGTTVGLSGLPVTSGVDCLIADDPAELAAAVVRVLSEPLLGDALAAAARDGRLRELDRATVADDALAALGEVMATRPLRTLAWASGLTPSEAPDGLVVMDEYAMVAHHLNPLASSVLVLVDGETEPATMAADLADAFAMDPAESAAAVDAALAELVRTGLVVSRRCRQRD